jgi:hypothetical protein
MADPVAIEYGIRQLHARYVDAVWRKDVRSLVECYNAEGQWRIAGRVMKGRKEIADLVGEIFERSNRLLLTFRTPLIDVNRNGVSARTYVTEQCSYTDRPPRSTIGIYHDRFVRSGDRWAYEWRMFETIYLGGADLSGDWFAPMELGPMPAMPPRDAVPVAPTHSKALPPVPT